MNLDDDYVEPTDGEPAEEPKYTLTPKGLLLISLYKSETFSKYFDLNSEDAMKIANEAWASFENYVRKNFGKGANAGGVVFDVNNGEFYSIGVQGINGDGDEDDD